MLLKAKLSAPQPDFPTLGLPVLNRVFEHPLSLFVAPDGYLLTDSLAGILKDHGSPVGWVRLGMEDCDPGTLILSIASGLQRISPLVGGLTFEKMRVQPGPVMGWEPLFYQLAVEMNTHLSEEAVLVLENLECLVNFPACLKLLFLNLLSQLRPDIHSVLISRVKIPRSVLPDRVALFETRDLLLEESYCTHILPYSECGLTAVCIQRAIGLTEGRPVVLAGLINASLRIGPGLVDSQVKKAANLPDLLARIVRVSLSEMDEEAVQGLAMSLRLGYNHPLMTKMPRLAAPWIQPLSDGWEHLRGGWSISLRNVLQKRAVPSSNTVYETAAFLAAQNANFQAVNLYLGQSDTHHAAAIMAREANAMMDLGQWATLDAWLKCLPAAELETRPWLMYIRGKLAAAQGQVRSARRAFAAASGVFLQQADHHGACLSLLAESSMAAWQGEILLSRERALEGLTMAQRYGLSCDLSWFSWQLGSLAASAGSLDEALRWFQSGPEISSRAPDQPESEPILAAKALIERKRQLLTEETYHQQQLVDVQREHKDLSSQLQNLLNSPPENLDLILKKYGWTQTPLMANSSAQVGPMPEFQQDHPVGQVIHDLLQLFIPPAPKHRSQQGLAWLEGSAAAASLARALEAQSGLVEPAKTVDKPQASAPFQTPSEKGEDLPLSPALESKLEVRLLGAFQAALNGQLVLNWSNNKARSIFKYLVIHSDQNIRRDVLMDTFWPDSTPEAARNNLNVAIHAIRKTLLSSANHSIVVYRDGGYRLDSGLALWVDVQEFSRRVQSGRKLEDERKAALAIKEYETAIQLYKGDFCTDDPYEEWVITEREPLRVAYLDALDHVSQLYLAQENFHGCISICQLILEKDKCREDAHCRLMRCYSRLDQNHLALRQFQLCSEALKVELDVLPAQTTILLYEKVRKRELI